MAAPKAGDKLINDHGTCVELAEDASAPGTYPLARAQELLDAGYRPVKKDEEIPLQQHEADALSNVDIVKNAG